MVDHLNFIIPACLVLTLLSGLALLFITFRSQQWAAWVDRENAFWVRLGFISTTMAERCKRVENGAALKLMAGFLAILSLLLLLISLHFQNQIHPKRKMPGLYLPAKPAITSNRAEPGGHMAAEHVPTHYH